MHRQGADPSMMSPEDFLCDFCMHHWTPERPMVEGHRGSLICGRCLTVAYAAVHVLGAGEPAPEGETCLLCLSQKLGPHWRSEVVDARPLVCADCLNQAARQLEKDRDSDWKRPVGS